MKTFAYAYNPPDDFHERVDAYAKKNGVRVRVVTDTDIEVTESRGLFTTTRPTMAIHYLMDREEMVYAVTLNGRLDHPAAPGAEAWFVNGGGAVLHIDDPHPVRVRRKRTKKARSTFEGRRDSAKKGNYQSGPAPIGYRRKYGPERKSGHLVSRLIPDPKEAKSVRRLFKIYLELKSTLKTAKRLNKEGIRTKRGGKWSRPAVSWVLRNPLYAGMVRFGDIRRMGNHDAIVSRIIWNKAQALLNKNNKRANYYRAVNTST